MPKVALPHIEAVRARNRVCEEAATEVIPAVKAPATKGGKYKNPETGCSWGQVWVVTGPQNIAIVVCQRDSELGGVGIADQNLRPD
jgi:hypothetical protein